MASHSDGKESWFTRKFLRLEKPKPGDLSLGQFIAIAVMMAAIYIGTHGLPN